MKRDLYQEVTQRIVDQLKNGVCVWRQPWSSKGCGSVMPKNAITGRGYSGVNVLLLWTTAQERGYADARWLTYQQATEAGGQVRKGEKGSHIVFTAFLEKQNEKTGKLERIPFLKGYTVFNVAQCDGLPQRETVSPLTQNLGFRNAIADEFLAATDIEYRYGESRAYFNPRGNFVMMPDFETFISADAYYETVYHETIHATGHETRLNRVFGKRFGDETYSAEELVAEIGSAFIMAEFGFDAQGRDGAYIAHWVRFLEDHTQAIVSAASMASKAVEFLRSKVAAEPEAIAA